MTVIQKPVAVVIPRSLERHQVSSITAFLATIPTAPWTLASRRYSSVAGGMTYTNWLTIRRDHEQPNLRTHGCLSFPNSASNHHHGDVVDYFIETMAEEPRFRTFAVFQSVEDATLWVKMFGGRVSTDPMFAKHFGVQS